MSRFIVVKRGEGYFIELVVSRPEEEPRVVRRWGPYNKREQATRELDSRGFA